MSIDQKKIQEILKGSMVAMVTPMLPNGDIDYPNLADMIDWQIEQGSHCIVAAGTTGESATLSIQEHSELIRFFVAQVAGRVPLIAGTGANNTKEAIQLTQHAKDAGADFVLLVAPYYNKPPQEGLYQHYRLIASSIDIPQILYNVPGRTAVDIDQETVERLANIENIVAIKDATGSIERGKKLIELVGDRLVVLSGDDATALTLTQYGCRGNISVTANIAPKAMSLAFAAALEQDMETARKYHEVVAPLHQDLFIETSPIPVKYALHKMGRIKKGIRLPLVWLDQKYNQKLDEALTKSGLV
ncbi:4-hydroxy-tetrahydrodipicolinate synthase [Psychrobacter pygoscelis]|uniref:4-hydroxy-tetrahydrodipicolinate synthase n=1 Tax=Psychrobacter pygoscelis TaxID=2488563 RepID=UPI00103B8C2D|nr:4-hydroxy-tetrahydrodipicolinate synthase [Psychrobacter pygoscelis]